MFWIPIPNAELIGGASEMSREQKKSSVTTHKWEINSIHDALSANVYFNEVKGNIAPTPSIY